MKICKDGRIWGQTNISAGDHLGVSIRHSNSKYVKTGTAGEYVRTPEYRKKMSETLKNSWATNRKSFTGGRRTLSRECKEKISAALKGKALTGEHRLHVIAANKTRTGRKYGPCPDSRKQKIRQAKVGKKLSPEAKRNMRIAQRKRLGDLGIVNKAPFRTRITCLGEYLDWHASVMERDCWTCQTCGHHGGKIIVHHIKRFLDILKDNEIETVGQAIECLELWDIDNGQVLCEPCHHTTYHKRRRA